jgi:hypothetical protein
MVLNKLCHIGWGESDGMQLRRRGNVWKEILECFGKEAQTLVFFILLGKMRFHSYKTKKNLIAVKSF